MSFPRLPAYRISGPMGAKLRLVTVLAVTAVLCLTEAAGAPEAT